MVRVIKSYLTALRASRRFGRASRLTKMGRKLEAISMARETLIILSQPHVIRTNPAEASVLACATVLLEELAHDLKEPGANTRDIDDSLKCIRALGSDSDLVQWIPYLESRSGQRDASAV